MAGNFGSAPCGGGGTTGVPLNCLSLANNTQHAIKRVAMSDTGTGENDIPDMATAMSRFDDFGYNDTVMRMYITSTDPEPDVVASDFFYPEFDDTVGWVRCSSDNTGTGGSHPSRWCRGQQLRINTYFFLYQSGYLDTTTQRRRVACHELGHTVGLRHRPTDPSQPLPYPVPDEINTCMFTMVHDSWGTNPYIRGHDKNHIDEVYG